MIPPSAIPDPARRTAFTTWERADVAGGFSVVESASRLGQYAWIEKRLFESLGRWAQQVPEADVKICLAEHSFKHGWHAELWQQRFPTVRAFERAAHNEPASSDVAAFVNAVADADEPEQTIEKLVGVFRVLIPRKVAAYRYHLQHASAIGDAPTIRSLRLVLADELEDWCEGELLLQSLLVTPDHVERAGAHQTRVETLAAAAGGINGHQTFEHSLGHALGGTLGLQ